MYRQVSGRIDTDPHLIAIDSEHGHFDVVADGDGFSDASSQYEQYN